MRSPPMRNGNRPLRRRVHLMPPVRRHQKTISVLNSNFENLGLFKLRPLLKIRFIKTHRAVIDRVPLLLSWIDKHRLEGAHDIEVLPSSENAHNILSIVSMPKRLSSNAIPVVDLLNRKILIDNLRRNDIFLKVDWHGLLRKIVISLPGIVCHDVHECPISHFLSPILLLEVSEFIVLPIDTLSRNNIIPGFLNQVRVILPKSVRGPIFSHPCDQHWLGLPHKLVEKLFVIKSWVECEGLNFAHVLKERTEAWGDWGLVLGLHFIEDKLLAEVGGDEVLTNRWLRA